MDSTLKAVEEAGQKVGTVLAQFLEEEQKGKKGKK
jgi:hypothetical protein